ncbi:MAG: tetratricopeptide repeat protein [Gemmatimonadota bacterium]
MRRLIVLVLSVGYLAASPPLVAQAALERGVAAMAQYDWPAARQQLTAAVATAPDSYEANWRLAEVLIDIGKATPDDVADAGRDSLYAAAERYARRAVATNPEGANGHFVLANALGRVSLTRGKRERVELAVVIRNEALKALGYDPEHAGAYHILGRWHAEILRLSSLERFFAKQFLGADIFDMASWSEAERYLRLAIQYEPRRVFHHLDLGLVYLDEKKWSDAARAFEAALALPIQEPMDAIYHAEARERLTELARRKGTP